MLAVDSCGNNVLMAALMQPSLVYSTERSMYDLTPPTQGAVSFKGTAESVTFSAMSVIAELQKELPTSTAFQALVNARNSDGLTPVHLACSRLECSPELVEVLLETNKQDLTERPRSHRGNTPLHLAAIQGNAQVVKVRRVLSVALLLLLLLLLLL